MVALIAFFFLHHQNNEATRTKSEMKTNTHGKLLKKLVYIETQKGVYKKMLKSKKIYLK